MSFKKVSMFLIILVFINTLLSSCFNKKLMIKNKNYNFSIGMLATEGGVKDKSFNELIYNGLLKVKEEYGVKINLIETENSNEYQYALKNLAQNNDLIYAVGSSVKDALEKVASTYINKNFVLVDAESEFKNVKSITFRDEEGSFLVGIIAGMMSKTNKVGFIGGVEEIASQKLKSGYIAGVNSVNLDASKDLITKKNIRYVGNFTDIDKAYNLAKSLYDNGCDIIFNAVGLAGIGVFRAAKETGKFAIGSDQDQALIVPEYKDVILSSVIENIDKTSYETAIENLEGVFKGGMDNKLELGLKEDRLHIAESTKDNVPKEILDLVEKYRKAIINGIILVPKTPYEVKEFKRQTLK